VSSGSWIVVRELWFVIRGSWIVVRGLWFVIRGSIHYSRFTIHDSLFTIHYSRFTIHDSLFTIHYSRFTSGLGCSRIYKSFGCGVDGPISTFMPFIVLYAWPKLPMYGFSYHHSKIVSNTLFCAKLQFIVKAPAAYKMSAANRGLCGLPASLTADTPPPAVPRRQPPSLGPELAGSRELGRLLVGWALAHQSPSIANLQLTRSVILSEP